MLLPVLTVALRVVGLAIVVGLSLSAIRSVIGSSYTIRVMVSLKVLPN